MSILTQKTLSKKITFSGIGIHTGIKVNMNILPASPNSGIVFKRIDLKNKNLVYPYYNNVVDTTLCTTIENNYGVNRKGLQSNGKDNKRFNYLLYGQTR